MFTAHLRSPASHPFPYRSRVPPETVVLRFYGPNAKVIIIRIFSRLILGHRRAATESSADPGAIAHVYDQAESEALAPGMGVRSMVRHRSERIEPESVAQLRRQEAQVMDAFAHRSLQDNSTGAGEEEMGVEFVVLDFVKVLPPPSPPPNPPLPPGTRAPPRLPPSPPLAPRMPPPRSPINMKRFGKALGALEIDMGFAPPPPPPPMPPSPSPPLPSPPKSPRSPKVPKAPPPPGVPPSPRPPSPRPPARPSSINAPPLPPGVGLPPSSPPKMRPPPPAPAVPALLAAFKGMSGMGVYHSPSRPVLWFDDPDFKDIRQPRSSANLISRDANACNFTLGACVQCPRAWQANETVHNVTILFREPWQLDAIHITQLQNPGVLTVELLPWPAVPIPGLPGLKPVAGTLSTPIWNVTNDVMMCGTTLVIPFGKRAGTSVTVPKRGKQDAIPPALRSTALGGVNIVLKPQPKGGSKPPGYSFVYRVTFDGRALYPNDANLYKGAA
ncbi:hypothetical protein GPECTOR_12g520 [Gonium pectorale]|uniref:Uncharacterized protein n=1 Tax=Gonium pectorale TaxID=33097 RepID=A0A150GP07_GONPE|nr:hypothetical protein GPECTOR_12g520 [Gonium pectorale]|eukprot:KXZ51557.1 hypothetical protein GPECTOR_12g520 [Gonium pectorale]